MKAILMCAGKATRLMPLTMNLPKSLLEIKDKSLIEHTLETLSGIVNEVIIVVGYLKEKIINQIGHSYADIKINYVIQEEICGTGRAVYDCRDFFRKGDKFLVLNGDDLYAKKDILNLLKNTLGLLSSIVEDPSRYGVLKKDENNHLSKIVEKPKTWVGNDINIGCYLLNYEIFEILKTTKPSERGEIELTSAVAELAELQKLIVVPIQGDWLPVNYMEDYDYASKYYLQKEIN